tara:strand:+ start:254 stop:1294 length:1041 start_codon:yes stop_codon:yes gene_type:complete
MEKQFIIHAGTHKTASTYIQERLWVNRKILYGHGLRLLKPRRTKTGQFTELAGFLKEQDYPAIEDELGRLSSDDQHVVVSAEQFTQPLLNSACVDGLQELLEGFGYRLKIVIFLRDQPDYINSLYVQEVRRFYHSRDLPSFTKRCRMRRAHWFDYDKMFSYLLDHESIQVNFLPYGSGFGDPFLNLINCFELNLPEGVDWVAGNSGKSNDQPGVKGVWLALKVCKRMQEIGVNLKLLQNQSKYIRKYSIPRGWSDDRFFGMRPKKVRKIREFYKDGNDRFARRVWGKDSWSDVYQDLRPQVFNVLDESVITDDEMNEMEYIAEQVFLDIKTNNPLAFPPFSEGVSD